MAAGAFIVAMLLTGVVVVTVDREIDNAYISTASLVILGPNSRTRAVSGPASTAEVAVNPFLGGAGSEAQQAQAAIAESLADLGALPVDGGRPVDSDDYRIANPPGSPLLRVGVETDAPSTSLVALDALISRVETELEQRQEAVGVPPRDQLGLLVLRESDRPRLDSAPRFEIAVVIGALGAMLAAAVASCAHRRSSRPEGGSEMSDSQTDHEPRRPTGAWERHG
ncbi:MAG: hypothetical protein U5R31_15715 [Acidimicrobiia bacterium]|nr:hypothetical protein [Acidimicrobiia bacterium]